MCARVEGDRETVTVSDSAKLASSEGPRNLAVGVSERFIS